MKRLLSVGCGILASLLLFCFPGSPTVYYGDEAGLEGYGDPFCRTAYPYGREDADLIAFYKKNKGPKLSFSWKLRYNKKAGKSQNIKYPL